MKKVYEGIRSFRQRVFPQQRGSFERLAQGQQPRLLLVTCSDSRIVPSLLTQSEPGEVFVVRNAGNLVPPYGEGSGGEAATVEYAIEGLGIPHIAVCGHSHCGAMAALREPATAAGFPALQKWLEFARPALDRRGPGEGFDDPLLQTVAANVLLQLDHLRTHPAVAAAEGRGAVELHGWIYRFETGEVLEVDADGVFHAIGDAPASVPVNA